MSNPRSSSHSHIHDYTSGVYTFQGGSGATLCDLGHSKCRASIPQTVWGRRIYTSSLTDTSAATTTKTRNLRSKTHKHNSTGVSFSATLVSDLMMVIFSCYEGHGYCSRINGSEQDAGVYEALTSPTLSNPSAETDTNSPVNLRKNNSHTHSIQSIVNYTKKVPTEFYDHILVTCPAGHSLCQGTDEDHTGPAFYAISWSYGNATTSGGEN